MPLCGPDPTPFTARVIMISQDAACGSRGCSSYEDKTQITHLTGDTPEGDRRSKIIVHAAQSVDTRISQILLFSRTNIGRMNERIIRK